MPKASPQLDVATLRSAARTADYEARRMFRIAEVTKVDELRALHREAACMAVRIASKLRRKATRIERAAKRAR